MTNFISQLSVLLFLAITGAIIYFVCGSLERRTCEEEEEAFSVGQESIKHKTQIMGLWRAEILDEKGNVIRTAEIPDVRDKGFYIGRNKKNDLCIENDYISQEHAVIGSDAHGFFLKDCQSKNGTYYQNRRITTIDLKDNRIVYFGKVPCRFVQMNLMDGLLNGEEEKDFTKVWNQEVTYECANRKEQ